MKKGKTGLTPEQRLEASIARSKKSGRIYTEMTGEPKKPGSLTEYRRSLLKEGDTVASQMRRVFKRCFAKTGDSEFALKEARRVILDIAWDEKRHFYVTVSQAQWDKMEKRKREHDHHE